MKKILFVNSSLTDGGSERVMTLIANELSSYNDLNIEMVLLRDKEEETYILNKKVKKIKFKYNSANKILIAIKRFKNLRRLIKKGKYDYIISFMYDINIFTLLASFGIKAKIIVSERNNPNSKERRFIKKFERIIYKKAYKIVFQTQEVKEMYNKKLQNKSVVIPNPVNEDIIKYFDGERKKEIVSIGRLTEQKNFKLLIDAFAEVHKIHKDYKLIIYGKGHLLADLEKQIRDLDLEKFVELPGYVKDINSKISSSSMFVLPSNYEGISNAMLEAMSMGIPTICTDCPIGGARMTIQNMKNGILIPVNDKDKLIEAINLLIENKELASKISEESKKIKNTFSLKNIGKMWLDIMN